MLSVHCRRRRLRASAVPVFLVATLSALPSSARSASTSEPAARQEVVDRIQRECLRAYPPDLLARMASGVREIPEDVEGDPKAQMQFLDKEVPLDKGLFYPVLLEDMLPAFERHVTRETRFLDLGSGDGRVVFLANVLGADAVGIEYDMTMVRVSRRAAGALEDLLDAGLYEIIQDDFFAHPWSGYDVIFFFDLSSFEPERVRRKLRREMDPGSLLIVGFEQAPFPGLEVVEQDRAHHPTLKVYRQPAESPPGETSPGR